MMIQVRNLATKGGHKADSNISTTNDASPPIHMRTITPANATSIQASPNKISPGFFRRTPK